MNKKILNTVKNVIRLLSNKEYDLLDKWNINKEFNVDEFKSAINSDYLITIMDIPTEKLCNYLDIIKIDKLELDQWSVNIVLWTKEDEGVSEYTLELTLVDSKKELMDIEIDNLHIL